MSAPTIYVGIKFPFSKGSISFPASATDDELIKDSLLQIVLTMSGERIMRPDFGSQVMSLVMENNNEVLSNLLRSELQSVVARYEPRIQLTDVLVAQRDTEVTLTLVYIVLATRRMGSVATIIPIP